VLFPTPTNELFRLLVGRKNNPEPFAGVPTKLDRHPESP
jgi:hypothetical protein